MTTKKKAAGLDALAHVAIPSKETMKKQESKQPPVKKTKPFPLHLPLEVHQTLREIAFHEHTSMTKIILQGIDIVLKQRGIETIEKLKDT